MGKSAPKAPDYTEAAEATAASNQEAMDKQTWANRVNQYNPWGSIEYAPERVVDPSTGKAVTKWSQTQTLTPLSQQALDQQLAINAQKSDFASQLMDRAGNTLLQDTDWGKFGDFGKSPLPYGMREVDVETQPQTPPPQMMPQTPPPQMMPQTPPPQMMPQTPPPQMMPEAPAQMMPEAPTSASPTTLEDIIARVRGGGSEYLENSRFERLQ